MKVLLFCPTARLEPETVDSIMRLDPAGNQLDVIFTRHNPTHRKSVNILLNYRRGREMALAGGYDALFAVESDMIIPPDALAKLCDVEADIACGLYVHRHYSTARHPFWNPQIWREETTEPEGWLNWYPDKRDAAWGQRVRISGGGLGCALIHRRVLEALDFRLVFFPNHALVSDCDTWLYHDAIKAGFTAYCDLSVICGHKQPNGAILWPDRHAQMWQQPGAMPPSPYTLGVQQHGTANA